MGGQHWLVVDEVPDKNSDDPFGLTEFVEWDVEHPNDCPRDDEHGYTCAVGWQISEGGARWALKYSGTPVTEPGRYPIVFWHETIRGFDYTEHDAGIAIGVEP